jgi:hypothetical protein
MPEISRFLGIVIQMFFDDHNPPHFHARYGEKKGTFEIETLNMMEGDLPIKVRNLIIEWADLNKEALLKNWNLAQNGKQPFKINPLV